MDKTINKPNIDAKDDKGSKKAKDKKIYLAISIIALVLSFLEPVLGLVLALMATGLALPSLIDSIKNKRLSEKGGKFITNWILCVIALYLSISMVFISIGKQQEKTEKKVEQVYSSLSQPDMNGLTIADACSKVREAGWRVSEITNEKKYSQKSDCSDTTHTVTKVYFHDEKYYSLDSGLEDSDFETVSFKFYEQVEEESAKDEKTPSNDGQEDKPDSNNTNNGSTVENDGNSISMSQLNKGLYACQQAAYNTYGYDPTFYAYTDESSFSGTSGSGRQNTYGIKDKFLVTIRFWDSIATVSCDYDWSTESAIIMLYERR